MINMAARAGRDFMEAHKAEAEALLGFKASVRETEGYKAGMSAHAALVKALNLGGDIRPALSAVRESNRLAAFVHNGICEISYTGEDEWACGFEAAGGRMTFPMPLYRGGNYAEADGALAAYFA